MRSSTSNFTASVISRTTIANGLDGSWVDVVAPLQAIL
jgi:hypothetical protein